MISKWKAKAIVQKGISFLPFREKINHLFQKYVTKGVQLTDQHFEWKIGHASDHLKYFRKYSDRSFEESGMLELGTGWYPVVPIAMFLYGMKSTTSIDIQSWMNKETQLTTINKFKEWYDQGKLQQYLPQMMEDRWNQLMQILADSENLDMEGISGRIGLVTLLKDAGNSGLPEKSMDFISSNNTFEHIPKKVLIPILREFKRVIKDGGVMSHFVDMSDHFAHFDKSITIYNFLRFTEQQWDRIDNSIQPQNRMRWVEYKQIYAELQIPITEEETRTGNATDLHQVPLAPQYANMPDEELLISHGYLVTRF